MLSQMSDISRKIWSLLVVLLKEQAARSSLPCASSTCFQPALRASVHYFSPRRFVQGWPRCWTCCRHFLKSMLSFVALIVFFIYIYILRYPHSLPLIACSKTQNSALFILTSADSHYPEITQKYDTAIIKMSRHYKIDAYIFSVNGSLRRGKSYKFYYLIFPGVRRKFGYID